MRAAATRLPAAAVLAACFLALPGATPQEGAAPLPLAVEPSRVDVRMLYHETTVHVTAHVPTGHEVAILLVGEEHRLALKRKGKVFGLIWMNVGDVTYGSVPDVYLLTSTCDPGDLADPAVLDSLRLGFDAVEARSGGDARADSLFGELVRLKERDGLWSVATHAVSVVPDSAGYAPGMAVATADFVLPAKAPPGEYRVLAYAFDGGVPDLAGEGRLEVAQAGAAAFISGLARSHALLYGILAVLIAGAAGLLTGVIFGRGARKGH